MSLFWSRHWDEHEAVLHVTTYVPFTPRANSSSESQFNEDSTHILLARFQQPPKYAEFAVEINNPLIPILKRLPDFEAFYAKGQLVEYDEYVQIDLISGDESLGSFDQPDVTVRPWS